MSRTARKRQGAAPSPNESHPVLVRLSDVRPESVSWVWPGRLAAGKVTLLVGDPGFGKSWLSLDVAARLSAGLDWPDGAASHAVCDVLLLSAEDGLADTIRPRLDLLGADVARVHHLPAVRCGDEERAVQLADADAIERAIIATRAALVVIDPLSAYLGKTDSHRDGEVRGLLAPLAAAAERTGAAVFGVMHLSKSSQRPAIYRASGSIAFAAAARIVLAVAVDPQQEDRRLVVPVKSNLSAPPAALAFTLADGRLTWESGEVSRIDVNALLAGPAPVDHGEQTDAEQVIAELIDNETEWPLPAKQLFRAGADHGVKEQTMRRAARKLGLRARRVGFGEKGRWVWYRLSGDVIQDSASCMTGMTSMSPMSSMPIQSAINDNNIDDTKLPYARARGRRTHEQPAPHSSPSRLQRSVAETRRRVITSTNVTAPNGTRIAMQRRLRTPHATR